MPLLEELVRAAATAPGHLTGFFEIHDSHPEKTRRGSRGAGLCLDLGATTYLEVSPADRQEINVYLNREPSEASVTTEAVRLVLGEAAAEGRIGYDRDAPKGERSKARVDVHTTLDLPVSQGFGMSAAGALSAALATARALGVGRSIALKAAHVAEVQQKTGLGDVIASATGGFEVRVTPGIPPYGNVRRLVGYGEVVLCVLDPEGGGLETAKILRDRSKRKLINDHGGRCVDSLLENPNLDNFLTLSREFAEDTGLMTPELAEACEAARDHGLASQAMLGNSVFAIGRREELEDVLSSFGEVYVTGIEDRAARLLDVEVRGG